MEIYDIIDAASINLNKKSLVLHKSMKVNSKFKIYKTFCYNLYKVSTDKKSLIHSYEETIKTSVDDIDNAWISCDKNYLNILIKWISSDEYKYMIDDGIQQVPDSNN